MNTNLNCKWTNERCKYCGILRISLNHRSMWNEIGTRAIRANDNRTHCVKFQGVK